MRRLTLILYILLWMMFIGVTFSTFPFWLGKSLILIFVLIGLGAWLYGNTFGFVMVLLGVMYTYLLSSVLFGDINIYYENRLAGALLGIVVVILVGNLRSSYDALKAANTRLDHLVEERNIELNALTVKLIDDAEKKRIFHGQKLHDGIGQQLTGIQLYCASLAEQLLNEKKPSASIAFAMCSRAEKAHNMIRKTARMLFPVRIGETGLIAAINELASCFRDMKGISLDVTVHGECDGMPDRMALSLYRICHETSMCAVTELQTSELKLTIKFCDTDYELAFEHDGASWTTLQNNIEQRLIMYRLQLLGGQLSINQSGANDETIIYHVPRIA